MINENILIKLLEYTQVNQLSIDNLTNRQLKEGLSFRQVLEINHGLNKDGKPRKSRKDKGRYLWGKNFTRLDKNEKS